MMEDDPDYGYYCETGEDNVTPVNTKRQELIASNVCCPKSVDTEEPLLNWIAFT